MEDKDNPRFLLEQKIASLNTVANVSMTWWVSSVVFCASIFAAVWLYRKDLYESGIMGAVGRFLFVFFLSIVVFGSLIIYYLVRLRAEMSSLSAALGAGRFFSRELKFFTRAMIAGTFSFALIPGAWFFLYRGLAAGKWMPKETPAASAPSSPQTAQPALQAPR